LILIGLLQWLCLTLRSWRHLCCMFSWKYSIGNYRLGQLASSKCTEKIGASSYKMIFSPSMSHIIRATLSHSGVRSRRFHCRNAGSVMHQAKHITPHIRYNVKSWTLGLDLALCFRLTSVLLLAVEGGWAWTFMPSDFWTHHIMSTIRRKEWNYSIQAYYSSSKDQFWDIINPQIDLLEYCMS
jgi:hypothetical protein